MTVNEISTKTITLADATSFSEPGQQASALNSDAFMSMLLAQMRNQNPFEPMKDNEMMVQMAQMNSVQELQKMGVSLSEMNQTNQLLSGTGMMGKLVSYSDDEGNLLEALIDSITVDNSEVLLSSGETTIRLSDILQVRDSE